MVQVNWTTGFTTAEKVLIPAEALLAGYGMLLYSRITRRLRDRHPNAWQALGSPALLSTRAAASGLATVHYLLGRGHRQLGDEDLNRLARRWRSSQILFLCGVIALAYQVLKYGP